MNFEETILRNLLMNKEYRDKVYPFLEDSFFQNYPERLLFQEISNFIGKYKTPPSRESLALIINDRGDLNEDTYKELLLKVKSVTKDKNTEKNNEWLIDETERYCQEQAVSNAISQCIDILDGTDNKREKTMIPEILKDALGVSFRMTLGHSYKEDGLDRLRFYKDGKIHIPCDLVMLDRITDGGVWPGSLNVAMADTGVGKSIFLCHMAAAYMTMGLNVVYFTMEMGEKALAQRIDANLMDMTMDSFGDDLDETVFEARLRRIKNDYAGDIRIKEFGSGTAHAGHFRQVIDEYKLKENFTPDIIIVDYLAICASERWKPNSIRHDLYLQSIAEELRNIGKEMNIPVWSAHQTNRDGAETMDVGKKNTGNSYGILQTVDLMFALITSDDLQKRKQIVIKQIKNRYWPEDKPRQFIIGLDKSKMRFYNLDHQMEQEVEQKTKTLKQKMEKKREEKRSGIRFE